MLSQTTVLDALKVFRVLNSSYNGEKKCYKSVSGYCSKFEWEVKLGATGTKVFHDSWCKMYSVNIISTQHN